MANEYQEGLASGAIARFNFHQLHWLPSRSLGAGSGSDEPDSASGPRCPGQPVQGHWPGESPGNFMINCRPGRAIVFDFLTNREFQQTRKVEKNFEPVDSLQELVATPFLAVLLVRLDVVSLVVCSGKGDARHASFSRLCADALAEFDGQLVTELVAVHEAHRAQDCPEGLVETVPHREQRQRCSREQVTLVVCSFQLCPSWLKSTWLLEPMGSERCA